MGLRRLCKDAPGASIRGRHGVKAVMRVSHLLKQTNAWMPSKCFVSGCRSNYNSENKVRVFSFPRNDALKTQWLQAIHREDKREPSKASKICALHFKAEDIVTEASGFDSKTQEIITVPLQKHRLRPNAIPSIFNKLSTPRKKRHFSRSSRLDDNSFRRVRKGPDCVPKTGSSKDCAVKF
ncbi:hypothetical protein AVEN_261722-1 [Araneus ventricosus]|uniref:THAP-type domain-containing protein n=1 Tax=Araneus ventricosus TaxID=182803 RepID=A0A4Y2DY78_ARAVE|nr:hypothetical protein AVEN_261722-1 [Araneus ventricosus]